MFDPRVDITRHYRDDLERTATEYRRNAKLRSRVPAKPSIFERVKALVSSNTPTFSSSEKVISMYDHLRPVEEADCVGANC